MFDITPTKTFKDSVHGYINIPVCFVNYIIDTDYFQRLRNIDQTGMRMLYPNAKHDRFGHSLGVFYLGNKAVDVLLNNFSSDIYWKISSDNNRVLFWAKNKLLFLLACLLHDIGHTPFSHSLENIVLENSREKEASFSQTLINKINERETFGEKVTDLGKAAAHEKMGAMIVLDLFSEHIKKIYEYLNEQGFPHEQSEHILYAEHYHDSMKLDLTQIDNDICFIARMILGLKYQGYEPEMQIRNCFIELLNGANFDVDKLDYVIRDTKMSGISNIDIDTDRLLGSVCIVLKTRFINYNAENGKFSNRMLHSLNNWNNSDSEVHLKGRFSGTLIIGQEAEVSIAKESTFAFLAGSREDTSIVYTADSVKFDENTIIYADGTLLHAAEDGSIELPNTKNRVPFKVSIQNAKLNSDRAFRFRVCGSGNMELHINGYCDVTIKGNCKAEAEITFHETPCVEGKIREMEFMGNEIEDVLPTSEAYNVFSIGYKKQALSIIANVLEARNYLYLWIYAHHKVIYYANFLIPAISSNLLPKKKRTAFPYWNLSYKDIRYLDDSYVWTVVKGNSRLNSVSAQVNDLCMELLNRRYKRSLFKSLAEYDLLFESFTTEQKRNLKMKLADAVDKRNLCVMEDGVVTAGFLCDEVIAELKKQEGMDQVSCIVYVDVNYKRSHLNTHETFVVLSGKAVSLDKILLLSEKRGLIDNAEAPYFYLYYSSNTETAEERKKENEAIRSAIKEFVEK